MLKIAKKSLHFTYKQISAATKYNNYYFNNYVDDVEFWYKDKEKENRVLYITNNPEKHLLSGTYTYPEDIIYVPGFDASGLRQLEKADKIYVWLYLLKFLANEKLKNKHNIYFSAWVFIDLVQKGELKKDWNKIIKTIKTRYSHFQFSKKEIYEWFTILLGRDISYLNTEIDW
ncbi:hypothetical protein [Mycoplasma procyoni]|uniref:hypothetical protein n=1 Tax=Mycoplasma procyoni TaxID=568784 RepID=UPI00197B12F6|nr:hypothetical protein [Mycoplasma procyoni]MBN3534730.1 hypothetical protein [Mycoplasma procyoni]